MGEIIYKGIYTNRQKRNRKLNVHLNNLFRDFSLIRRCISMLYYHVLSYGALFSENQNTGFIMTYIYRNAFSVPMSLLSTRDMSINEGPVNQREICQSTRV